MTAVAAERSVTRSRSKWGRWLVAIVVLGLVVIWLAAITSTHAALSGGQVGWTDPILGHSAGLSPATAAEQAQIGLSADDNLASYAQVWWVTKPGGEISFGFALHNGGLAPVTVLSVGLPTTSPYVINVLALAGEQLGPVFGQMTPWRHPVADRQHREPIALRRAVPGMQMTI